MLIPLTEPKLMRYIRINPSTNQVHLLMPFVGGQDISTDNTCKSEVELKAFFEGGAVSELEFYKSTLEFHISLLAKSDSHRLVKEARLSKINTYIEAVIGMRSSYKIAVAALLSQPSNLYSIQLRPRIQDHLSRVVNPVFTVNRGNDSWGTPLSPLYSNMHAVFPALRLGKPDPRTQLIEAVMLALPEKVSFENIRCVLTEKCQTMFGMPVDFQHYIKQAPGSMSQQQTVDKAHIDDLMGFGDDTTSEEYVDALLGVCAASLWTTLPGSPFYSEASANPADKAERLSMMTQFYLGVMNVYCRAKGISNENFGERLDGSLTLSQALVETVSEALSQGEDVEHAVVTFFNAHSQAFNLSRALTPVDKEAIQQKFEITYRTVTATKENPHMDDFMLLDTEARGENDRFFTRQGLICTYFSSIVLTGPHEQYFKNIRQELAIHPDITTPQDESVITVDIEPEELMDKLSDVQWEKLSKEIVDACRALPAFQVRQLSDDVAKGKQDEANAILQAFEDKQTLLRTLSKFTDYSGRLFHCTAYEYAYWAKDTHMCRMLESHMDDETKTQLLERVKAMERSGLAYQQNGLPYQNPHYDMSFVLKDLNPDEFRQLQTMTGQKIAKIKNATVDNYATLAFTATEYEQLKKELAPHTRVWNSMLSCSGSFQCLDYLTYPAFFIASFFITSSEKSIGDKLQFDFHSLIGALESYINDYDRSGYHEREMAWLEVGKAQRDVPAHVAHEYCRPYWLCQPRPQFNEGNLPRNLKVYNYIAGLSESWFPLVVSGLGVDFAVAWGAAPGHRGGGGGALACRRGCCRSRGGPPLVDLAAIRGLDAVRTIDLAQSLENLTLISREPSIGRPGS